MKIKKKQIIHILILIVALFAAFSFRLVRLGTAPLNNMEAEIALQALAFSQNEDIVFNRHAAYVGLTGVDFIIFSASNFLARFWPAIFGALIVLIPFVFRDRIGHWPASGLSLILALSPEMVGNSRIIGTPMMAFVSLVFAFGFIKKKPTLSGVMFAISFMSGSGFWSGILVVGIGLLLSQVVLRIKFWPEIVSLFKSKKVISNFLVAFPVTIIVIGTGFFLVPAGLSGVFGGTIDFINGFTGEGIKPYFLKPLALLAYTMPAIVFGLWASIRAWVLKEDLDRFLSLMAISGLLFLLIYPGAEPSDLIWVSLPLWTLTVRVIHHVWKKPEKDQIVVAATAFFVVIVFAFMLLTFRTLVSPTLVQDAQLATIIALAGGVILLIAAILLVTFGWSEHVALSGLLIGLTVIIFFGSISLSVRSTSLSTKDGFELWYPNEAKLTTHWLSISLERVMDWNKGSSFPLEIVVTDINTPGMRWALRKYGNLTFTDYLPPSSQPDILISDIMTQPEISNSYRGQDLVWVENASWNQMSPGQYLNWLITKNVPFTREELIFWVKTDKMPQ